MRQLTIEIDDDIAESLGKIGSAQNLTDEQAVAYLLDRTLFGVSRRMGVPAEAYKPQSVMVMTDDSDDILKHFRCPNCGNIVFDYCGSTKLIMNGRYDRDSMLIDGETVITTGFGMPTLVECQGRVLVQYQNGRNGKVRCGTKVFKLRA